MEKPKNYQHFSRKVTSNPYAFHPFRAKKDTYIIFSFIFNYILLKCYGVWAGWVVGLRNGA